MKLESWNRDVNYKSFVKTNLGLIKGVNYKRPTIFVLTMYYPLQNSQASLS